MCVDCVVATFAVTSVCLSTLTSKDALNLFRTSIHLLLVQRLGDHLLSRRRGSPARLYLVRGTCRFLHQGLIVDLPRHAEL